MIKKVQNYPLCKEQFGENFMEISRKIRQLLGLEDLEVVVVKTAIFVLVMS